MISQFMLCDKCKNPMRNMGEWPLHDEATDKIVQCWRWHCIGCDSYPYELLDKPTPDLECR